jgi:hypothetical protein
LPVWLTGEAADGGALARTLHAVLGRPSTDPGASARQLV